MGILLSSISSCEDPWVRASQIQLQKNPSVTWQLSLCSELCAPICSPFLHCSQEARQEASLSPGFWYNFYLISLYCLALDLLSLLHRA